jgi:hypothetical protein
MEATLKFALPEEQDSFELASNGWRWQSAMLELDNWLRSKIKYEDQLPERDREIFTACQEKIYEILNESGLRLD